MNEDGTPIAAPEPGDGETGGTTPEEVLSVMGKGPEPEGEPETPPADPDGGEPPAGADKVPADPDDAPADPETPPAPAADPTPTPPAPAPPEEAPSFAVEVEDAQGNKITIEPGANIEEVLKDFEPKSNGQIFQIIKDVMAAEQSQKEYQAEQEQQARDEQAKTAIAEVQAGWDKEITALQGSKRLPVDAAGKSEERVTEVFKFMADVNAEREKNGQPPVSSFEDALDKLELKERKDAEAKKAKEEKDLARKRGGIVGGSSAPASSGGPTYAGGARNANAALRQMGFIK